MAAGTTSFIHVLSNISLQDHVPAAAALCDDAGRLVNITNRVVIAGQRAVGWKLLLRVNLAGVPSPDNPRPELDWAGWCGIVSVAPTTSSLQLSNLTLANLPVGPSVYTPLSFFTAVAFIAAFNRGSS
ncbi:hypothetical protein HaLaN_10450 [Haematococcus lacustris]|uniref:Uncharacterized protein n=1 Tax=Haematococcus lacustris TaxID=44745 RepID=A0A699ZFN9_HAELA|nr:hypothetical protein HaLaN_10450 [Haematococcus lacustris]